MDFLKKLGLMKDEDPPTKPPTAVQIQPVTTFQPTIVPSGSLSKNDYKAHLDQVRERANQPGLDFFEFDKALVAFEGKPIAEQQKYEFAFSTFQAMGITPLQLIQAADTYIKAIEAEEIVFNKELAGAEQAQLVKEQRCQTLAQENSQLMAKIEQNNQESQKLAEEVYTSKTSLVTEKKAFDAEVTKQKAVIQDRITKIQTYLHATTS